MLIALQQMLVGHRPTANDPYRSTHMKSDGAERSAALGSRGGTSPQERESQSAKLATGSRDGLAILGVASSRDPWRISHAPSSIAASPARLGIASPSLDDLELPHLELVRLE